MSHILLGLLVIMLLMWPAWRLRKYSQMSKDVNIPATFGRVAILDIILFAIVYAWFGLFSWRNLAVFIAVNASAATLPHLLCRFYKPLPVPVEAAFLHAYIELFFRRRWLCITLFASRLLFSLAATATLYLGFSRLHNPDYRSIFAVVTISMGIYLIGAVIQSWWLLSEVAVDSGARIRLLLGLYSASIFFFVCALAAGPSRVIPNLKFYLLTNPNHFQVPVNVAIATFIVLLLFTILMSIGEVRQAGKLQELAEFQETLLRKLKDGLMSSARTDKLTFIDTVLRELREWEAAFRLNLVSPGAIIEALHDEPPDQTRPPESLATVTASPDPGTPEEPDALGDFYIVVEDENEFEAWMDKAEEVMVENWQRVTDNAGLWNTADSWDERVTELQGLTNNLFTLVGEAIDILRAELAAYRHAKHYYIRSLAYYIGRFLIYSLSLMWMAGLSLPRKLVDYLAWMKDRDLRWRHFFWLQSLIADLTYTREQLQSLQKDSQRKKYIKEYMDSLDYRLEDATRLATDARAQKRFGARVVVPYSVPLTMAIATPFIHIALGFNP